MANGCWITTESDTLFSTYKHEYLQPKCMVTQFRALLIKRGMTFDWICIQQLSYLTQNGQLSRLKIHLLKLFLWYSLYKTSAGYTVRCMYNITVCTTTQLTARRPHTKIYIHIEKLYSLHQGINEKPNHNKRHCDLKYRNSSLFVRKINSLDSSSSTQRRLEVPVGRSWFP